MDHPRSERYLTHRLFRAATIAGTIAAAGGALIALVALRVGGHAFWAWYQLATQPLLAGYFGWIAYDACLRPVLRITDAAVELRPLGARTARVLPLSEIAGLRWQDSFDLRVRTRSGEEWSAHLGQVAARDRARAVASLNEFCTR